MFTGGKTKCRWCVPPVACCAASFQGGLRDGDDGPHLLELCVYKIISSSLASQRPEFRHFHEEGQPPKACHPAGTLGTPRGMARVKKRGGGY